MNPRLAKEFRALRLPWVAGMAAGLAAYFEKAQPWGVGVAFASVAAMTAMSLGSEYQQGTFALLLSQPLDRLRIWREKLLVSSVLAGTVALALLLGLKLAPGDALKGATVALPAACLVAVLCSAGYWTMMARSTIGGMVFTYAGMFLIFVAVNLGLDQLAPPGAAPPCNVIS